MAITSIDGIVAAAAAGHQYKTTWTKQVHPTYAPYTAGRWYDTSQLFGLPTAETFAGTALTAVQCVGPGTPSVCPGCMQTGGTVEPTYNKYLASIEVNSYAATNITFGWLLLVDMLMYYPGINMNSNLMQILTTNVSLPRYTDGHGVQMYLVSMGTTGATASNIHPYGFDYTSNLGTAGRVIPGTVALTASSLPAQIIHSGVAVNNVGPFLPLEASDDGVQSVQTVQFTAATGTAVTATLVLCRPIAQIPIATYLVPSGRDFLFSMPIFPRIYDGAYLNFLYLPGGATAASNDLYAVLDFVWG